MAYTYNISQRANTEEYNKLKDVIAELYPEYEKGKEIRESDESRRIGYTNGENTITCELSYSSGEIVVFSDIELNELGAYYKKEKKHSQKDRTVYRKLDPENRGLFIKCFVIPVSLIVLGFLSDLFLYGSTDFILYLGEFLIANCMFWIEFGFIMLIPAIAFSNILAEKKGKYTYKIPLAVWLFYMMIHNAVFHYQMFDSIRQTIESIDLHFRGLIGMLIVSLSSVAVPAVLFIAYFLFFPLIAADELGRRKHYRLYNEKASRLDSAFWWLIVTVASVLVSVVLMFLLYSNIRAEITSDSEITNYVISVENEEREAMREFVLEHDEIYAVAEYIDKHKYTDTRICPDPSIKNEWDSIFGSDEFRTDIEKDINGDVYVIVCTPEDRFSITAYGEGVKLYGEFTIENMERSRA